MRMSTPGKINTHMPTYDTFCMRPLLQHCQAKITNFHNARRASDEDVLAFQVSVDDGWIVVVEELQAFQNLQTPALDDLPHLNTTKPF